MSCSLVDLGKLIKDVGAAPGRLKICIDLNYLHVDQYDLSTDSGRAEFFAALDRVGLENIAAAHMSDSGDGHGGKKACHMK